MSVLTNILLSAFLFLLCFRLSFQLSCKDERNNDVDWFVNYKIPEIQGEPKESNLGSGKAYAYITAPGSTSWKLSSKSIMSGSMMEITLNPFYSNKQNLTYLFYNDDPPSGYSGSSVGHLKGVVAFDDTTGFWLVHSIPKFADDNRFSYPDNALINGQSILCVTFRTAELNEICNQLIYTNPNIFASGITNKISALLDDKAKSLFTDSPSFVRDPLIRTTALKSLANKVFMSFAKDNQYHEDLFSGVIAPGLKSSLLAETWRRGSGTALQPSCQSDYSVLDIVSINMTVGNRRNSKVITFKSTEDHSKWAISENSGRNWICIADMNRMMSQERRGGGALCFVSSNVRNAYKSIIAETDQCPKRRPSGKK